MFEFHGWATIRVHDRDDPGMDVLRRRGEAAIARLREAMREADDEFSLFDLRRTSNELIVLLAHGLRNHRYGPVIDLFRWVAAELPDSYGLLYAHDDEAEGCDNEFRVWRLARGRLEEVADPLLSPYTPTVEPPSPFACDVLSAWLSLLDNLRVAHPEAALGELAGCVSAEQADFLRRLADRAREAQAAEPGAAPDGPPKPGPQVS